MMATELGGGAALAKARNCIGDSLVDLVESPIWRTPQQCHFNMMQNQRKLQIAFPSGSYELQLFAIVSMRKEGKFCTV